MLKILMFSAKNVMRIKIAIKSHSYRKYNGRREEEIRGKQIVRVLWLSELIFKEISIILAKKKGF